MGAQYKVMGDGLSGNGLPRRYGWDEPTAAQINNPWPGDPTYREQQIAAPVREAAPRAPQFAPDLGAAMIDGALAGEAAAALTVAAGLPEAAQF